MTFGVKRFSHVKVYILKNTDSWINKMMPSGLGLDLQQRNIIGSLYQPISVPYLNILSTCVSCLADLPVHTEQVLPLTRGPARPALWPGNRHVESWLYSGGDAHRRTSLCRLQWGIYCLIVYNISCICMCTLRECVFWICSTSVAISTFVVNSFLGSLVFSKCRLKCFDFNKSLCLSPENKNWYKLLYSI